MTTVAKTEHPHIERRPGVCGGSPVIEGTRIPVRLIVSLALENGMTVQDIAAAYPRLKGLLTTTTSEDLKGQLRWL